MRPCTALVLAYCTWTYPVSVLLAQFCLHLLLLSHCLGDEPAVARKSSRRREQEKTRDVEGERNGGEGEGSKSEWWRT